MCGHTQSVYSVLEHNPDLEDIPSWIHFACEGRRTPGQGCDWSLGGLLKLHKTEVILNWKTFPVFEFAEATLPQAGGRQ